MLDTERAFGSISKKDVYDAVLNLKAAWAELSYCFSSIDFEANDYIVDGYPFHKSFDELDVTTWCQDVADRLSRELEPVKPTQKRIDPCDIMDENGQYHCPYADTYTGYADEICRVCCGKGVDE